MVRRLTWMVLMMAMVLIGGFIACAEGETYTGDNGKPDPFEAYEESKLVRTEADRPYDRSVEGAGRVDDGILSEGEKNDAGDDKVEP